MIFKCDFMLSCRKSKLYHSSIDSIAFVGNRAIYSINKNIISIDYNLNTGKADYKYGSDIKVSGFESVVKVEDSYDSGDGNMINTVVKSSDYTDRYVTYDVLDDGFGQGELYTVVNQAENLPTMYQHILPVLCNPHCCTIYQGYTPHPHRL